MEQLQPLLVERQLQIFFSEYVGSFNKALEIANFTGAAVDLSVP
jgi:hypothetical protein